jgi:nickel/cobalt exporter
VPCQAHTIGIAAVIAMSLGMSIPIGVSAYLGWFGRTGILLKMRAKATSLHKAGVIIEIVGLSLLFVFSVYIALPFIVSLTRLAPMPS